jgi:hypothetical protein
MSWLNDSALKNIRAMSSTLLVSPIQGEKMKTKQKEFKMNNKTLRERLRSKDFKDIENWDVSNVTNMNGLFFDAR